MAARVPEHPQPIGASQARGAVITERSRTASRLEAIEERTNMIDFDIFTIQGAKRFLRDALHTSERDVEDMARKALIDEVAAYDDVRRRLEGSVAPDDLLLHLRHVTANTDGCASIRESGILGIKDVLSRPNALTDLFLNCGVRYDKADDSVIVKGRRYALSQVDEPLFNRMPHLPVDDLLRILAKDSVVNAFIHESCIRSYSSIAMNPEVVEVLERIVGQEREAIGAWRDNASPYVVEFTATLDELDTGNLIPDGEVEFLRRCAPRSKDAVFNNLVFQALMACAQGVDNPYAFMPPGCGVPPSSIARITPLDTFCGSPEAWRDSMCDREGYRPICQEGK